MSRKLLTPGGTVILVWASVALTPAGSPATERVKVSLALPVLVTWTTYWADVPARHWPEPASATPPRRGPRCRARPCVSVSVPGTEEDGPVLADVETVKL